MHDWARVGPFTITHKSYTSRFAQGVHSHERSGIDFNISGGGVGSYRGEDRLSQAGQIEFFAQGAPHTFACGPRGIRTLHVVFMPDALERPDLRRTMSAADEPRSCDAAAACGHAVAIYRELLDPDESSPMVVEGLAWQMLGDVARWPAPDGDSWLKRAIDFLRANPTRSVGLAELAEEVGLHRAHLARVFHNALGLTPGEYHRRVRAAEVVKRLAHSKESITRVACALGFADQAHLTRVLKRCVGITPAAMRRVMHRTGASPGG